MRSMQTTFLQNTNDDQSKRGGALLLTLILSMALMVWVGSIMQLGVTEANMNNRHHLLQQANLAAETVAEYGFAEMIRRYETQTSVSNDPLELPSTFYSFFNGTNVVTNSADLFRSAPTARQKMYINPTDPANINDKHKGRYVWKQEVDIYARASVEDPKTGDEFFAYVKETLQLRDSPLFSNAIFYNMDLEIHNGPVMDVYGPVHTNGDMWVASGSGLNFHDSVTAAGNMYHGYLKTGDKNPSSHTADVNFTNVTGTMSVMKDGGNWLDSLDTDWHALAHQKWDGMVQDASHGVPQANPISIEDYVPDDPFTGGDELQNHAYALIEPVLPDSHTDYKGEATRAQKFSYKAGLLLKVDAAGTVTAHKYERSIPGNPNSAPVIDGATGLPKTIPVPLPAGLIGDANSNLNGIDSDGVAEPYSAPGSDVEGGMYDHRQDEALDVVSIDIGKLREYVDDTHAANSSSAPSTLSNYWGGSYDPSSVWNRIVYVVFEDTYANSSNDPKGNKSFSGEREDKVVSLKNRNIALQTINASEVPYPEYTTEVGLTVATNAPLYVAGNFNADGDLTTGNAQNVELRNEYRARNGALRREPPAALIADSITLLSNNWSSNRLHSDHASTSDRSATDTEVSAALLTGMVPTTPDAAVSGTSDAMSGGAHNFPRFLENWGGRTLTIRGSLVALFASEVHDDAIPSNFGHYYNPPNREWGFNENFANGIYPPGTPNTRTYPRVAFRQISEEEFNDAMATQAVASVP